MNTHVHSDHTGANAFFAKQGALIYSQENLRNEMLRPPPRANGQRRRRIDMAGIPVVTYSYNPATPGEPAVTFHMNGETVDFIPMMPSHTAGDTIVRFRNANVIYIEDFYRNFGYPVRRPEPTADRSRACSRRSISSRSSPARTRRSFPATAR